MTVLWVSEYGKISCGAGSRIDGNGNLELNPSDFLAIKNLLQDTGRNWSPFFQLSVARGREVLKVQNFVGVIRTSEGTQIEVLPKVSRHADPEVCRQLLIKMLVYLRDAPFRSMQVANLNAESMPLFELIMRYFVQLAGAVVRRGIARSYVEHSADLKFLRGKLALHQHIKRNAHNAAQFYCDYDEYEANRPINRILHTALHAVSRQSRQQPTLQLCRELLFFFTHVPLSTNIPHDFQTIRYDRQVVHYEGALKIARLILQGLNPLSRQGQNTAVSMLFPMERVFEDFVTAKLRHQFPQWQIRAQLTGQSLIEQHLGNRMFGLRPDLELCRGGIRIIADTKWKLLQQQSGRVNYNIAQADIYQLFAYCKKYLTGGQVRTVILIYPETDQFCEPLEPFWYSRPNEILYVLPFNLTDGQLLIDEKSALFELINDQAYV